MHVARVSPAPFLAIDPHHHREIVRITKLIRRDEARPHDIAGIEGLSLARPELTGHFPDLLVARRDVVEDRIAEDVLARLVARDVLAGLANVAAELQFEIEHV